MSPTEAAEIARIQRLDLREREEDWTYLERWRDVLINMHEQQERHD